MMTSFALAIPSTAPSIISTSIDDLKSQSHDSRSAAAKQFEFELGYIIENYVANGKERFVKYIEEHLKLCSEYISKDEKKRGNSHKMKEIRVQQRVWRLLSYLSKSENVIKKHDINSMNDDYYFDPASFIRDTFNADYNLRKLEYVILWLQEIAPYPIYLKKGDISYSRTMNQSNNTRHPSLISLDPDVITRNNIDLNTLSKEEMDDLNDEEKLLNTVFRLIRKGLWNDAINLCRNYGEHWRASSLNGRYLFNDKQDTSNQAHSTMGNEEYLMWLRVCRAISEKSKSNSEKWIYSTLCGNVEQLLTYVYNENVDGNWFDLLWVLSICKKIYCQHNALCNHLPSFYHNDLKNKSLNNNQSIFKSLNIINKEWQSIFTDFNSMFNWIEQTNYSFITKEVDSFMKDNKKTIKNNNNNNNNDNKKPNFMISKLFGFNTNDDDDNNNNNNNNNDGNDDDTDYFESEYNYQYYKICKFIICEQKEKLLESCWEFINNKRLKQFKNGITLDFMRFVIHLYLHLNPNIAQKRNKNGNGHIISEKFMNFIKIYISKLIECGHYDMIARYCYILPKQQLIDTLTEFLISLDDTSLRIKLITKSKEVLPPQIITRISANIAKSVIDESVENSKKEKDWLSIDKPQPISNDDYHQIDSLKCLQIVNDSYNEILFRANQLFTVFAKQYKLEGIQKLFNDIHQIIDLQKPSKIRSSTSLTSFRLKKLQCHFNTFQCFQCYKLVIDAFNTWNKHHFCPNIDENDKIKNINLLIRYIRNMLQCNNGWLNPKYCAIQTLTFQQIDEIRGVIIKRLLTMIYRFIYHAEQYEFCLELTTIFADEKYSYYTLFNENKNVIKNMLNQAKNAKIEIIKYQQQIQRLQ